jgi:amino acid permease
MLDWRLYLSGAVIVSILYAYHSYTRVEKDETVLYKICYVIFSVPLSFLAWPSILISQITISFTDVLLGPPEEKGKNEL